jgi:5-methylcytosine-specific restriction endonuclease McrA
MRISQKELDSSRTEKGGFTQEQIDTCKAMWKVPPSKLKDLDIADDDWQRFKALGHRVKRAKRVKKVMVVKVKPIINKMSINSGSWDWKPENRDVPVIKFKAPSFADRGKLSGVPGNPQRNAGIFNAKKIKKAHDPRFYHSDEWRMLRVRVLEKYECKCMMCGRSPKNHRIIIHVDHIKPISKYPELCLEFNNLQLLCEDCNIGKSNKYETDYRPQGQTR